MATQPSVIASAIPGRSFFPGRSASLSSQIIGDVRDALFARKLKPGDVLGTENEIAARYGVSRIVARDALRTLDRVSLADPFRAEADRLRADIQRDIFAAAGIQTSAPDVSGSRP